MKATSLITHLRAAIVERDEAIAQLLQARGVDLTAADLRLVSEAIRLYATVEPAAKALIPKLEAVWAEAAQREAHRAQMVFLLHDPSGPIV